MTALDELSMLVQIPIVFRKATKTDLPKLEWYGEYAHFRNVFLRTFRDQEKGQRIMLLADANNFPIGHIFISLKSQRLAQPTAYLYSLRVMEMFRGNGIGSRLIAEAENLIVQYHIRTVSIAVAKNNQNAFRLYARLGYRIYSEDDGRWSYIDHRGQLHYVSEPCWILEKKL